MNISNSVPNDDMRLHRVLAVSLAIVLIWSAHAPLDRLTWWMEVFPVFLGGGALAFFYGRWTFSQLVCAVLWLHAVVLIVGGHYTYALVPLGNWARDFFHLSRNHYDRFGHFLQGLTPALVSREVFIRRGLVKRGPWLFFICLCVPMAISACYELLEWQAAVWTGAKADAFLGTQGDPWDTQEDMAMAFVGALFALGFLTRRHDRSMQKHVATAPSIAYKVESA